MPGDFCPCGSGKRYTLCCEPYLTGQLNPETPVQLMRSRYSAFCQGMIDYLIATHHPTKRQSDDRSTLAKSIAETEWLGLRVITSSNDVATQRNAAPRSGIVEFVAFYRHQGHFGQLHERSEFICQNERWFYVDGVMLPPILIGRNDPCWCGSGRKYKKCHGG